MSARGSIVGAVKRKMSRGTVSRMRAVKDVKIMSAPKNSQGSMLFLLPHSVLGNGLEAKTRFFVCDIFTDSLTTMSVHSCLLSQKIMQKCCKPISQESCITFDHRY